MNLLAASAVLLLLQSPSPDAESVLRAIQQSHIEGNLPSTEAEFHRILQHGLDAYFTQTRRAAVRTEYELLRKGPTQSGVSCPKFYLWVRVLQAGRLVATGAVRVAAVDKVRIEVTSFTPEAQIRQSPEALYEVFPRQVADAIKTRLGIGDQGPRSEP